MDILLGILLDILLDILLGMLCQPLGMLCQPLERSGSITATVECPPAGLLQPSAAFIWWQQPQCTSVVWVHGAVYTR
jgi:hypothetical protein